MADDGAQQGSKQARHQARLLREQAEGAWAAGDFAATRRLLRRAQAAGAGGAAGDAAAGAGAVSLDRLRVDPLAWQIGLGTVVAYLMAWALAL